jgi:hypothetical protein
MKKMTVAMKQPAARTQAFQAGLMPVPVRLDVWVLLPDFLMNHRLYH